jgi:hypothetical protein
VPAEPTFVASGVLDAIILGGNSAVMFYVTSTA